MLRDALHLIASALLWIVFVLYWSIVLSRPMNPDTRMALVILSVLVGLAAGFLAGWIYHNVRLYRISDRRRARRRVDRIPERDYLERILVFEERESLARSNYIEVDVKPGFVAGRAVERKIFKARVTGGVVF